MGRMARWICYVLAAMVGGHLVYHHLTEDRGLPATNGIRNFGRIDDHLYRGAQPDAEGVARLKELGVAMIINLRAAKKGPDAESAEAQSHSILYTNIPLQGMGRPSLDDMTRIISLIEKSPGPVFVHCEHGCDRTGTVVACYRIKHDGWNAETALTEADHYGMSGLERGMRAFVAGFARQGSH